MCLSRFRTFAEQCGHRKSCLAADRFERPDVGSSSLDIEVFANGAISTFVLAELAFCLGWRECLSGNRVRKSDSYSNTRKFSALISFFVLTIVDSHSSPISLALIKNGAPSDRPTFKAKSVFFCSLINPVSCEIAESFLNGAMSWQRNGTQPSRLKSML